MWLCVVRPINHPQISPKWYRRRFIPTFRRSGPGQAAGFLTANKDDAKWALKQGHPGILSDRDKTTGTSPNGKNHWDKLWWSDRSSSLFWRSFNLFLGIHQLCPGVDAPLWRLAVTCRCSLRPPRARRRNSTTSPRACDLLRIGGSGEKRWEKDT